MTLHIKSIKAFLLFWVLGIIALGTIMLSIISYYDARHEIEELFDAEMVATAKYLSQFPSLKSSYQAIGNEAKKYKKFQEYEDKIAYKIYDENLVLISQSQFAPNFSFLIKKQGLFTEIIEQKLWHLFVLYDAQNSRWLITAQQDEMRVELGRYLLTKLLLPFILGVPILIILVWTILLFGLKPLLSLAQAIEKKQAQRLDPIQLQSTPKEIKPIVSSLNHLFKEVSQGIEKEKRFTADAAHELRTPLSILKIHAQNAYASDSLTKAKQSISKLLLGVDNSTHLVEQLLKLTRLEPRQLKQQKDFTRVNFSQLIKMEVAKQYPDSLLKNQLFETYLSEPEVYLSGVEFALQLMIRNLIENAIRYTPEAGTIELSLVHMNGVISFSIKNSGEIINPSDKNRLFERFFRINANQIKGSGLGMSIIKQCVDIHRASITLPETKTGLHVLISFKLENTARHL
ncbi:MAG: ATP-binding protein [Pseudomonadota bacterium]